MDPRRNERVAESLRNELEEILNYELSDPRVSSVVVTEVLVAPDLKKAHVRLAVKGSPEEQIECLKAIEKAKGYIRLLIAERVELYRTPDLYFDSDLPLELRGKEGALLKRIRKGRPRDADEKNQSG
ncbi:MAG: 30S ribosome-binding factor RbfA [Bryobacterales bacterium]|nr:30S ribosome-binding factor RbfA [Bryobacterales bacterium]